MQAEVMDYFGSDLMVANAARVSYGKHKDVLDMKDVRLIQYMAEHKHSSPFKHPQIQFRVKCPIFVERHLFKHQIGLAANSISGRYVDFSDDYFITTKLRRQSTDSKQGSSGTIGRPDLLEKMQSHIDNSSELYAELCDAGVAKEQSRIILPLALNTEYIWTGSLLGFAHMWDLRLAPDTQLETQQVAKMMLDAVLNLEGNPFEHSLRALGLGDFV